MSLYDDGFELVGADDPTLQLGASGVSVSKLQLRLNMAGASVGDKGADGQFGPATQQAVINFQNAYGLRADGVVGPETWAKLYEVTGAPVTPGATVATTLPTMTVETTPAKPTKRPTMVMDPLLIEGHVPKTPAVKSNVAEEAGHVGIGLLAVAGVAGLLWAVLGDRKEAKPKASKVLILGA